MVAAVDLDPEAFAQLRLFDLTRDAHSALPRYIGGLQGQKSRGVEGLATDGADPLQGQDRQIQGFAKFF